jgi:hypothetical protein
VLGGISIFPAEKNIIWITDYKDFWILEAVFGLVEGHLH